MQPDLVLTANFVDAARPTITLGWPTNGTRVTSNQIVLRGTAHDNVGVTGALWRMLPGAFQPAFGKGQGVGQMGVLPQELKLATAMRILKLFKEAPPKQPREHTHRQEETRSARHPTSSASPCRTARLRVSITRPR